MLLTMTVSLYTSRVVLNTLGVEDFGVYNVVGGVVAMLGFLTGSLGAATSRFITYALGLGDFDRLKKTFANILAIHCLFALVIVVLRRNHWFMVLEFLYSSTCRTRRCSFLGISVICIYGIAQRN